jgi:hypothetical protein
MAVHLNLVKLQWLMVNCALFAAPLTELDEKYCTPGMTEQQSFDCMINWRKKDNWYPIRGKVSFTAIFLHHFSF